MLSPLARLKKPRTSSSAMASVSPPPPPSESSPSANKDEEEPSFLRTGEEAFAAVHAQSFKTAAGIFDHTKPSDLPFNPNADMTTLSGAQVAQAFQFFTGLHSYATVETAKCDADMTANEFSLKVLTKSLTVSFSGAKRKKYDIDAEIASDKRINALAEKKAELAVKRIALEATTKGLEEKAACLSRELTRRETEARISGRR